MPDEKEGIDKSGGDYLPADEAARLTGAEQERRSREGRAAAPHRIQQVPREQMERSVPPPRDPDDPLSR
ncbi:MAG TPA: hypothetical protein VM406_11175 [Noviherbaspirillum sp.]|nr:hypothetical protein [Noviherbaspirillum sp.]